MYDIIGDIHGCDQTLEQLLQKLGYTEQAGSYSHPERSVVFLGDFIDRGPGQREVISLVRAMIDSGSAQAVMGNHELNALAYHSQHPESGQYLRNHAKKNFKQHEAFLKAYEEDEKGLSEALEWFKTLPLWLDLGEVRFVHACWDVMSIERLKSELDDQNRITGDLLISGTTVGTWQFDALETLLKGKEIGLPEGHSFRDKQNIERHNMRVRWWDSDAVTYREAYFGPESARTHIPDDEISGDHVLEYSHQLPPVFVGHYWLEGDPGPLAKNIACLDYSVAKPGGKLVAYRWSGESVLSADNFTWVERVEAANE